MEMHFISYRDTRGSVGGSAKGGLRPPPEALFTYLSTAFGIFVKNRWVTIRLLECILFPIEIREVLSEAPPKAGSGRKIQYLHRTAARPLAMVE